MRDWFSPPKKVAPGWQLRIGLTFLAIWLSLYFYAGREAFSIVGVVAMGGLLVYWLVFYVLLQLLDPILRARFLAKWKGERK